jgi:raffinose/stachyose/melibiose transport system permease protein
MVAIRTAPSAAPARRVVPRRRGKSTRTGAWYTPWLFLLIPLAFLALFSYVPVVNMVGYSVTEWDGLSPHKKFVGLDNYIELFTRPALFKVFLVSLYYLGASFVQIGVSLYFATILSFKVKLAKVWKGILFFPYMINGVAVGFVFLFFFRPNGTLDAVLSLVGIQGHQWLGDPDTINYSLAGVSVWRYLGLTFVLFLGAIQSVPPDLYESSEMDGASRWQQFRYIILPGIKNVVGLAAILSIAGSIAVFEVPFIMTGGANGSKTFVIQTVDMAFKFNKFGLASAMAVVLLLIVLLVTWVQRRIVPDEKGSLA